MNNETVAEWQKSVADLETVLREIDACVRPPFDEARMAKVRKSLAWKREQHRLALVRENATLAAEVERLDQIISAARLQASALCSLLPHPAIKIGAEAYVRNRLRVDEEGRWVRPGDVGKAEE